MIPLLASFALAVPMELTHQGRMLDGAGAPFTGTHDVTVSLYTAQTGGSVAFEETLAGVDFDEGYYRVLLGTDVINNALETDDLDFASLWVEVTVNGVTTDRLKVSSVPYAVHAELAGNIVSGAVIDAAEVQIDGTTVIDGSGAFVGTGNDTLSALSCSADQMVLYDGSAWVCATPASGSGPVAWSDITGIPIDIADGDDDLGATTCADGQIFVYSSAFSGWGCGDLPTVDWSALTGIPADLADGSIAWAEVTGIPSDLSDGSLDWAELTGIPADLADGGIAWSEVSGVPADLSDGSIDWAELTGLPADLSDGMVDWTELTSVPPAFGDGAIDWSEVGAIPGDLADGVIDWSEVTSIPSDLADGDDVLDDAAVDALVENGSITVSGRVGATEGIQVGADPTCAGAADLGTLSFDGTTLSICGSSGWQTVFAGDIGTAANPGASCNHILSILGTAPDGLYWIDPQGVPFQVYCDMNTDGGGWTLVSRIRGNSPAHAQTPTAAVGTLTSPTQGSVARLDNADTTALFSAGDGLMRLECGATGKIFADAWNNYRTNNMGSPRNYKYGISDGWSQCNGSSSDHLSIVSTVGRCKGGTDSRDASYGCFGNCNGCSQANHDWNQDGTLWVR